MASFDAGAGAGIESGRSRPRFVVRAARRYRLSYGWALVIAVAPSVLAALALVGLVWPSTTAATAWVVQGENHPVELATFAVALLAGVLGLRLAVRERQTRIAGAFYAVFALAMLLIAFEEIAWGQWLFGFETPAFIERANAQRELTLHNLEGMQGKAEWLRIIFGVGGLLGIACARVRPLTRIAAPTLLAPTLLTILTLSLLDIIATRTSLHWRIDRALDGMTELVELLIASVALTYVTLNARTH